MTSSNDDMGVLCNVDDGHVRKGGLAMLVTLGSAESSSSVDLNGDLDVSCNIDDCQVGKGGLISLVTLGAAELSSSVDLNGDLGDSDLPIKNIH